MTYKENIKAILECNFAGYKEEIIENACVRIIELKCREDTINRNEKDDMIKLNDDKMRVIRNFIVSIMRDPDYMYNTYLRGYESDDDVDVIELVAYLYEIIHQLYYKKPYRYMFHWANKAGSWVDENNIDNIINAIMEEEYHEPIPKSAK